MSNDVEVVLARLKPWQEKICKSETESILDRWEFGRVLLARRGGKKQLPNGDRAKIAEHFRLEASEITRRIQLAERFETEKQVADACTSCGGSWRRIIAEELVKSRSCREVAWVERARRKLDRLMAEAGESDEQHDALMALLRVALQTLG